MASQIIGIDALDRIAAKLDRIADPDFAPLMEEWEQIIYDDNMEGVLAGTDKDGEPMEPVTYRPKRARNVGYIRTGLSGSFAGIGSRSTTRPNNNLSPAEYRALSGPPLAPRGINSRVITNLGTEHGRDGSTWFAVGYWVDVVGPGGKPFLEYAFARRDLRGVRPAGVVKAKEALRAFVKRVFS